MIGNHRFKLVRERRQPTGKRCRRIGLDLPVGDVGEAIPFGLDQPPASGAEPGVEAEDLQASFSSSSSGTS
jgi:hypothetical protein